LRIVVRRAAGSDVDVGSHFPDAVLLVGDLHANTILLYKK
jgi:hypothetical protein